MEFLLVICGFRSFRLKNIFVSTIDHELAGLVDRFHHACVETWVRSTACFESFGWRGTQNVKTVIVNIFIKEILELLKIRFTKIFRSWNISTKSFKKIQFPKDRQENSRKSFAATSAARSTIENVTSIAKITDRYWSSQPLRRLLIKKFHAIKRLEY